MKKILAVLLALAMLLGFAACGGNNEDTTTTTAEDTTVTDEVTEEADAEDTTVADESTTAADEETTVTDETTAAAEESTTESEGTTVAGETTKADNTAAPAADMSKAEFVKFLNAETAKIAKNGSYHLSRICAYTEPVDVGGFTDILNGIIQGVDKNSDLDKVVGKFIGIGETKGNVPKDDIKADYKVKASTLTEADLGNFKANNGTYTFTLANAKDPKKTGKTPLSRFTDNFIIEEEVAQSIAEQNVPVTVAGSEVDYTNIKVEVKVADGKITNIKYGYTMDATLILKVGFKITGTGAGDMETIYSNIKY